MKSHVLIEFEIERKIKLLLGKGIKPTIILMGGMAYSCLLNAHRDKAVKIPNEGMVLKSFNELDIVINPHWNKAGENKKEDDFVLVLGC